AAEFRSGSQIGSIAPIEISDGKCRRHHPTIAEVYVKPKTPITIKSTGAGPHQTNKRGDDPQYIAKPILPLQLCGGLGETMLVVRVYVKGAGADRDTRRIGR